MLTNDANIKQADVANITTGGCSVVPERLKCVNGIVFKACLKLGGGVSQPSCDGTCHFARKIGTHTVNRINIWAIIAEIMNNSLKRTPIIP